MTLSSIGGKSQVHGSSCGKAQVQDSSRGGQSQILVRWWNEDKLDTELAENDIVVGRTINQVDANVIDDNILGIGHENNEGNEDELDRELADNYSFVDKIIIKADANAIDDNIVGNGHEDD